MAKVIFVGDPHLSGITPSSRKETNDEYKELLLYKLDYTRKLAISSGCNTVIILGDLFNNNKNTSIDNYFETSIWKCLLSFKESGIDLYSIVGNHDMVFQNDTEFKGSYLYKCFVANIVKHLDTLVLDDTFIRGVDYNADFTHSNTNYAYNICVAHSFYENELFGGVGNGNLTDSKCVELGYNAYVLGHDHTPYLQVNQPSYSVIRTGSLVRGTSKTCNLYRKVIVSMFDTTTKLWNYLEIPTKDGKDVFVDRTILENQNEVDIKKIIEHFDHKEHSSFYDVLDQNEANGKELLKEDYDSVVDLITQYCEMEGLYRRGV